MGYRLREVARQLHFRGQRTQVCLRGLVFDPKIKEITRSGNALVKVVFPLLSNERIRIFTAWHFGDAHNQVVLQERLEGALGCFTAGGVGVEAENNFGDKPLKNTRLVFGERSPLRSNHVRNASFEQRNEIE